MSFPEILGYKETEILEKWHWSFISKSLIIWPRAETLIVKKKIMS